MTQLKKRYLITAALPYANGRLHVGHIAGAYLPADTWTRFLRLTGREAHYICGSDENGAPITFSALKEKIEPQEIIDRYHSINEKAFADLGIDFSIYGRTHSELHNEVSQEFFLRLYEKGHLQQLPNKQAYCTACDTWLSDRYIEGTCYYEDCGKPGARGDQCESCGRQIEATKLIDAECMVCKMLGNVGTGSIEVRETEHWYLRLDTFQQDLQKYVDSHPEWREPVKRFSNGLLKQGLRSRAITRNLKWGVPVPLEGAEDKVLYVWFDAPIGYITFTRQFFEARGEPEKWKDFWQDDSTGLVHFIGKDNTVFHAVMFPGMLKAHGDYRMPDSVVSNEFLNLEKEKISTSRNHAVWLDEYLTVFSADALRYYLTAIAPELSDSDFVWKDFQAHNNSELADNLGNFIQRNLTFCNKYFDGVVPDGEIVSDNAKALLAEIDKAREEITALLEGFKFKAALERLMRLSQRGNQFFAEETPWKSRKTDMVACAETIQVGLRLVEALGVLMSPFLPSSAKTLRKALKLPALGDSDWQRDWQLKSGHEIGAAEVLFPKIDDAIIEEQVQKLTGMKPSEKNEKKKKRKTKSED